MSKSTKGVAKTRSKVTTLELELDDCPQEVQKQVQTKDAAKDKSKQLATTSADHMSDDSAHVIEPP